MSVNIEYKEFDNIECVVSYYKKREYYISKLMLENYMVKNFYWLRFGIPCFYWLSSIDDDQSIKKEYKIKYMYLYRKTHMDGCTLYFYQDVSKIYTLKTDNEAIFNSSDYIENKLYHLIHGPKALSIPDAFRVLSL